MRPTTRFNEDIVKGLTELGVACVPSDSGMVAVDRTSMCVAFGDGRDESGAYTYAKGLITLMVPEGCRVMWGSRSDDYLWVEVYEII